MHTIHTENISKRLDLAKTILVHVCDFPRIGADKTPTAFVKSAEENVDEARILVFLPPVPRTRGLLNRQSLSAVPGVSLPCVWTIFVYINK